MRRLRFGPALLALLAAILAASGVSAQGAKISLGEYRQRLTAIGAQLDAGDWVGAGLGSRGLLGERVVVSGPSGGELIATDASLLGPISRATNLAEARGPAGANVRRLNRLLEELAELAAAGDVSPPPESSIAEDKALLERLRAREKLDDLPGGGALPRPKTPDGALEALTDFFEPLTRVLRSIGRKILDWLDRMTTSLSKPKAGGEVSNLSIAITVIIALALAGAAILYVRRRKRAGVVAASGEAPSPPAADDDPLSREVGEWERYARELERAGRAREAVRAWYHAVLVALYRTGFVHYRRGRTNWEYVSSLSPTLPVRSGFAELTRRFEREWYGRDESDPEALAAAAEVAGNLLGAVRTLAGSPD